MSQLKFSADITASSFPLLYDWAGRSIVRPENDQGRPPFLQPQILYCENVLPTLSGYKSVSFADLLAASVPANTTFRRVFTVADAAQNKALIGVTFDSKIFMLTATSFIWVDVTPVGWAGGDGVTTGTANGTHYLYLANNGCYLIDIVGEVLTLTALTGITAANIVGMFSAVNYLCLWDAAGTIYWSATTNPLLFTPSLITGAGSSRPYDLQGEIVTVVALGSGFIIYTDTNIVLASFSNNTQFPWIFRGANNSAGLADKYQVSYRHDLGFHVALTFVGVLQVTLQGCEIITPEVTDFLSARRYDSFIPATDSVVTQILTSPVVTSLNILSARYVTLSYGISSYTDILVFDTALKRWGKLHVAHVSCFELELNLEGELHPYNEASELGASYASASPEPYNEAAVSLNDPPGLGRVFGLLKADGSISVAYLDFDSINDTGVLILGKYQLVRNAMFELNEIAIESIATENTGFSMYVRSSINGKDLLAPVIPTLVDRGEDVRVYKCRQMGKNHTLTFEHSFNITAVEITGVVSGRR